MNREILIAVTFREFNGDVNDRIQREFLKAIKSQTYGNYKLVVTLFREKKVENVLKEYDLPYVIHQSKTPNIWHSFTEVVANAFGHLEEGKNILLWTNADNIFLPNFFEEIVNNFEPNCAGTSFPHMTYYSIEEFKEGKAVDTYYGNEIRRFYSMDPALFVPDVIYIDGDVMLDKRNRDLFEKHYIAGAWHGMSQSLMIAFYAEKLQNIIYRSVVANIQNVRTPGQKIRNRNKEKMKKEQEIASDIYEKRQPEYEKNWEALTEFCAEKGIHRKYWAISFLRKWRQHRKYKIVGSLSEKFKYSIYMYYYYVKRTHRSVLRNLRHLPSKSFNTLRVLLSRN